MERGEQHRYVAKRLRFILTHAIKTVPRYESFRPLLRQLQDPTTDVYSILLEFPVIARDEVVANRAAFRSEKPGVSKVVTTVTSGTTGTPFTTWMDIGTFQTSDALGWRRNLWSGYRPGEWIVRLVGDPIVPLNELHPKNPWRISWVDRRLYLSTFHLNRDTAHAYLDILDRIRPPFIMGYPSSLEILAGFCMEANRMPKWRLRGVWFSSEPMFEHQRDLITRVFQAPIRGFYGSAERILSAAECERGSYHLSLVDGYMEGQFGTLKMSKPAILTTLMNRVMPLIRFELGDVIQARPDARCSCGRTLPVIAPVVTKHEDWVETPSGRRVSPSALTWAFKDLQGVRRSQIVQVDEKTVVVHIDTDKSHFGLVKKLLTDRLSKLFFGEIKVRCIRDVQIKVMKSGKSKFVIRMS
jgi:phenylacetate-CoA ligase